jgi:hypothetical protein
MSFNNRYGFANELFDIGERLFLKLVAKRDGGSAKARPAGPADPVGRNPPGTPAD